MLSGVFTAQTQTQKLQTDIVFQAKSSTTENSVVFVGVTDHMTVSTFSPTPEGVAAPLQTSSDPTSLIILPKSASYRPSQHA